MFRLVVAGKAGWGFCFMELDDIIKAVRQEPEFIESLQRQNKGLYDREIVLIYRILIDKYYDHLDKLSPKDAIYLFKQLSKMLV
jgi:hypothetical protein